MNYQQRLRLAAAMGQLSSSFAPASTPGLKQLGDTVANNSSMQLQAEVMKEEEKKRKKEEKGKMFGGLGSTLGGALGIIAAPLTGGTSLLATAGMGALGSAAGGAAGSMLGGGKVTGSQIGQYALGGAAQGVVTNVGSRMVGGVSGKQLKANIADSKAAKASMKAGESGFLKSDGTLQPFEDGINPTRSPFTESLISQMQNMSLGSDAISQLVGGVSGNILDPSKKTRVQWRKDANGQWVPKEY